ncbi:MAG: lipid II:glycine glycyltransferase FemX [Syntrophobacteraceae bacterium]
MKAAPVDIHWHPGLPIFASESHLKSVGDEYGWLGGFDDSGRMRCILPYTIIRKAIFRMVRFRVETIHLDEPIDEIEERSFLNSTIEYFRSIGADLIIPGTNNAIFRTYPDGADAAPYGSYIIDLSPPEDILLKNIERITRQNIKSAQKKGVTIRNGVERLESMYAVIRDTFKRSKISFMSYAAFQRYVNGLGAHCRIMVADYQGIPQSFVLFAYSDFSAYAIYAGNPSNQFPGANKLIYWEAIRSFKELGVQRYDFVGARISPEKGSKQDGINSLKRRFGAELKQGYMWKYPLRPLSSMAYNLAVRFLRGGDIVDNERHKLEKYIPALPTIS